MAPSSVSVFILALAVAVSGQGFKPAGQVSSDCLNCICEATSECQLDVGCQSDGPDRSFCGPYHISYAYWMEAGSPGANPDDPLDFEKCLNHRSCAEGAIRGYLGKYPTDCDSDGDIDCFDHALLHRAGPDACNATWLRDSEYWSRFKTCHQKIIL